MALEYCRDELSELKAKVTSFNIMKDQLTNQIFEQKSLIERLERQKDRFNKRDEGSVSHVVYNELKNKHEELTKNEADLEKLCKAKQVTCDRFPFVFLKNLFNWLYSVHFIPVSSFGYKARE